MKRIVSLCCVLLLLCMCMPVSVHAADNTKTLNFTQMHGYYRALGRSVEHGACLYMDNTASGFEIYFYGSGDVTVNAAVTCSTDGEIAQYLTVYVDGVRSRVRIACDKRDTAYDKSIVLASGLSEGYHHIEVYRQTEAQVSNFRADSLTFTGRLLAAPQERALTIDVIGDSISGGYGCLWNSSLGVSDPGSNHPKYEDGTQTYAFLAGKALGADVRVLQSSGYGCVGGWNGRGVNLQTMLPYTCWFRSQTFEQTYDPVADVVIINLGTNDYNTRSMNNITNAEFQAGAKNLMQLARHYNPDATVVWCTGMMGTYYEAQVKAAINELGGAANGYHFLLLPKGQGGAVSHPTAAQQAAAGEVLLNFLKTTVLPADYTSAAASAADLRAAIAWAQSVSQPSAALTGAIERAQMELAVGTTDEYRLYTRLADLNKARGEEFTSVSLMPKQYVSETPTAADGVSFVWPYYDNVSTDGSVTLYKGGEGFYWPHISTALRQTVDIDETPYLRFDYAASASFNISLTYVTAAGELAYINASTLAGSGDVDLPAQDRRSTTVDFGAYIRAKGHADSEGLVGLVNCDMYAVGETDTFVRVYDCVFTSKAPQAPVVNTISGSYPVENGILKNVTVGMTVGELTAAMDHPELLSVRGANAADILATGMTLELTQNGVVVDSALIAVKGDLNGDGAASSVDARVILLALLGEAQPLTAVQSAAADVNNNAEVTTTDVRVILTSVF